MTYLLDTDWLIDYLNGDPAATALIASLLSGGVAISVITYSEVYEGVLRSPDPAQSERVLRSFLQGVSIAPLTKTVAKRTAAIRLDLRRRGKSVRNRALDLLIAGTALTYNATLVTRNKPDYLDSAGLQLY